MSMTESELRAARKAWAQRNSDQTTTLQPLPLRTIESEEIAATGPLAVDDQVVTWERHVHTWQVDNPDSEDE